MNFINETGGLFVLPKKWEGFPTVLVGDIHGEFHALKQKIEYNNWRDFILIAVGDIGIGFASKEQDSALMEALSVWFENRNILFLGLRGNHDLPQAFNGSINLSNFKLLQDYTCFPFLLSCDARISR
jgi:hypothetical protein